MTIQEINDKIVILENKLKNIQGTETEVYARIVGYMRPIDSWNLGKKEEYKERILFKFEGNK